MELKEKEHFKIQFNRQNSKYNRLWTQLSALVLFYLGTIFMLSLNFIENIISVSPNKIKFYFIYILMFIISIFCGYGALIVIGEMKKIKADIDGILDIFQYLAFPNIQKKN